MGYAKEKYVKSYFLCEDNAGKPTAYGVEGIESFNQGSIRQVIPNILASIDLKDKTILSIGYGRGEEIKYALDKECADVLGVDFSEDAYRIANDHIQKYYPDTDKVVLACEDVLAFLKRMEGEPWMNVVFMFDVLEHIPRDEARMIFQLLIPFLKPGAVIAVNTPFFGVDNDVVKEGLKEGAGDNSDYYEETKGMHCNRYTRTSFLSFMYSVGLELAGDGSNQFLYSVREQKKLKIAIWTYPNWAFGQIFNAIKKYSKHDIDIYAWGKSYIQKEFDKYDLIHIPVVQAYDSFVRMFPNLEYKVCCSTHGKAELFNYSPSIITRHPITADEVSKGRIPLDMVECINRMGKMACVSKELTKMLHEQTNAKIVYTPCGVDTELFNGQEAIFDHIILTVLCPTVRGSIPEHEYDAKRWGLVDDIEKRLPNIKFLFLQEKLPTDKMADFYRQGDVILCLSHSEGNPLGIMEAGAMGVLPVTTIVGEVPEIIVDGINGRLIIGQYLSDDTVAILDSIEQHRTHLMKMRNNIQDTIVKERNWKDLVKHWDTYFESCVPNNTILKENAMKLWRTKKKVYRFHMLGLVHLPCSKAYMSCAFTQKNHKLARMLLSLGHEVIYYGAEGSDVPCTKFIQTHTLKDICADYGDGDNRFDIGYDWTNTDFRHDFNMARKPSTLKFNKNVIDAINKTKKIDDFLLMTQGYYQKPIAEAVKLFLSCEPGVGYRGSIKGNYRAFESAYIQNFIYGSHAPYECINGSYYDRVIPNYFDPEDSEFSKEKKDYFFFIGRMIKRKGIITAYMATQAVGAKLIIAGQGGVVLPDGTLTATNTPDFSIPKGNWEYVGFVSGQARKDLFKYAKATFTPTEYLECFAGTHIESMLHGTPIITTDFGVFSGGTFMDGVHGFKCNTLDDFVFATKNAHKLDPTVIRQWAERYLMDNVKWEYQKWFDDLYQVFLSATMPNAKGWHYIRSEEPEWRKVLYPQFFK